MRKQWHYEQFGWSNYTTQKSLPLLTVAKDRGDKDEEARESVDQREDDPLDLASELGREEPNYEAETKGAAQDQTVPDYPHQLEWQWLIPEIFLSDSGNIIDSILNLWPVRGRLVGNEDRSKKNNEVEWEDDCNRN